MDVVNLVIYAKSNVWDIICITRDKCFTCDNAFIHFKNSLKNKSFGHDFIIEKCCHCEYHCKCIQRDTKNISNYEDAEVTSERYVKAYSPCECTNKREEIPKDQRLCLQMNGYELSVIFRCLLSSSVFRKRVIRNLKSLVKFRDQKTISMIVKLVPPTWHILDYAWSRRMEQLAYERMELNTTMSWLSTLGGAFSALGEEKLSCAGIAGRISVHQFKIALRLGDLLTLSRCKLYLALSLIQRGRLKAAKKIIYDQYMLAKERPEEAKDIRLIRMCQGLWSKLKYAIKLKQKNKIERKTRNIEP